METLHKICGVGLLESFNKRLLTRGNKTTVRWQLDSYLDPTRAVSHKAMQYAILDLNRRQVVFRIHSRQARPPHSPWASPAELTIPSPLQKVTRSRRSDGAVLEETLRDVVEYLVLEKTTVRGIESPWFIWGTTSESSANRD